MTTTKNKLGVELWDVSALKPHPGNAKKHSNDQVETLAGLIKKFGWTQPIIIEGDGTVIIGHGRRLAAIHLGYEKVPVVVRRDLDAAQAEALRLADNRVTSTDYDTALLQLSMTGLAEGGIDLKELGFDDKELEFMVFDDVGAIDEGTFVDDIGAAVLDQKTENAKHEIALDAAEAPVADAFGFRKVSIAHMRRIRKFMAHISSKTGAEGSAALVLYFDQQGL